MMDAAYLIKYQLNICSATWDPGSSTELGVRIQRALARLCQW